MRPELFGYRTAFLSHACNQRPIDARRFAGLINEVAECERPGVFGVVCLSSAWRSSAEAALVSAADSEAPYLVGRGIADITGPPIGVKMLGYVRPDQISEGIHLRQYARAFIVGEPNTDRRLAIVTTDLQSVTHSMVLSVLDKLPRTTNASRPP